MGDNMIVAPLLFLITIISSFDVISTSSAKYHSKPRLPPNQKHYASVSSTTGSSSSNAGIPLMAERYSRMQRTVAMHTGGGISNNIDIDFDYYLTSLNTKNGNKTNNTNNKQERLLQTSNTMDVSEAKYNEGSYVQPCSVCGKHTEYLIPDMIVDIPGMGEVSCGDMEYFASSLPFDSFNCSQIHRLYPWCCSTADPRTCEEKLREELLEDYDATVPPLPHLDRLNISVDLTIWKVTEVDVPSGTAEIFGMVLLIWNDPRLAWKVGPNDHCTSDVAVRASNDAELTEIWVPDLDLRNGYSGLTLLPEAAATVYEDGTVAWARAGALKALCWFHGITQIPFELLGCQYIFTMWNRLERYNLQLGGDDGNGLDDDITVSKYDEFRISTEHIQTHVTSDGFFLLYNLYFRRATSFYVNNIIVPTILLTYVSFGMFLLDFQVGERLGYGMTLALVIVATQIVTSEFVPVTNERVWIGTFISSSFYWVIFCLLQSVFVGYIYFLDELEDTEAAASGDQTIRNEGKASSSLLRRILTKKLTSMERRRFVARLDQFCLVFVVLSYTIFMIVMLAIRKKFGNQDSMWDEEGWIPFY